MNKNIIATLVLGSLLSQFPMDYCEAKNNKMIAKIKKQGGHWIDKNSRDLYGVESKYPITQKEMITVGMSAIERQIELIKDSLEYNLESVDGKNIKSEEFADKLKGVIKKGKSRLKGKQNVDISFEDLRAYYMALCNRLVPQLFSLLAAYNTAFEPFDKSAKSTKKLFDINDRKGFRALVQKISDSTKGSRASVQNKSDGKKEVELTWQDIENQKHQIGMIVGKGGGKDSSETKYQKYRIEYLYNIVKTTIRISEKYTKQLKSLNKEFLNYSVSKTRSHEIYNKIVGSLKKITLCYAPYVMNMSKDTAVRERYGNITQASIDKEMAALQAEIDREAEETRKAEAAKKAREARKTAKKAKKAKEAKIARETKNDRFNRINEKEKNKQYNKSLKSVVDYNNKKKKQKERNKNRNETEEWEEYEEQATNKNNRNKKNKASVNERRIQQKWDKNMKNMEKKQNRHNNKWDRDEMMDFSDSVRVSA